jgi:hypothetical protein
VEPNKMKNRQIKFRVWLDYNNSFEYPNLITFHEDGTVETDRSRGGIVQQYTGLKDQNSKEIFEGDILFNDFVGADYQEVIFENGKFTCTNLTIGCDNLYDELDQHAGHHIVGNIFETPELVKKTLENQ